TGRMAEGTFHLTKLCPVEIIAPERGATVDGRRAVLDPITVRWQTPSSLSRAQLVLFKTDGARPEEVLRVPSNAEWAAGNRIAPRQVVLDPPDGLRSGSYEIVIRAVTQDNFDISNTESDDRGRFTVTPIPKLRAPRGLVTAPARIDAAYVRGQKDPHRVTFYWDNVADATDYTVVVYDAAGRILFSDAVRAANDDRQMYTFDFFAVNDERKRLLTNGTFTWSVAARRRIDRDHDGVLDKVLQEGEPATDSFVTDIPSPQQPHTRQGAVNPYGN
ncbi:MAG: hypothetical protein IJ191_02220, partial [Treponema sp.]|nr:hypothetical protein [Treponema sp.]